ncbi:histidine phosphatase family protein [Limosilactobacillus caccae]|uniref:histidine phosphatase family protein n=1 Tax=Limosilactobacillus caccae TaxID=1926284 RepID=UPI000970CDEC|nr:histidine phosphatase family protein [Limosilactobacillus caccae]
MATTVYFVRHGETYFNCFARLQGWSDTPLTKKGEEDAIRVGRTLAPLKIDYLFSSDLKRAVDTARLLITQVPGAKMTAPTQEKCFRETFYGSFEGHSNEEGAIWASHLGKKRLRRIGEVIDAFGIEKSHDMLKEADPAHLAEDSKQLTTRSHEVINLLQQLPDNSTVVVVSHGSFIQYIASLYGHKTYGSLMNGAMAKFKLSGHGVEVESYNQLKL